MRIRAWELILLPLAAGPALSATAQDDPTACIGEIERVCIHMEDKLESCLSERGSQLSKSCRDQLDAAMELVKDPSGPAACIPDVQRLCPDMSPQAMAQCLTTQQANFSQPCQKYLQSGSKAADPHS